MSPPKMKPKSRATNKPPSNERERETKIIEWRMACRDALHRICISDANILRNVMLKVASRPAMEDARRHYAAENLAPSQVMGWPDVLYKGTATPKELPAALRKHRAEYHEKILTPELHAEVTRLWELHITWRDELAKRAAEAYRPLSGTELADWVCTKQAILYELSMAGVVPVSP